MSVSHLIQIQKHITSHFEWSDFTHCFAVIRKKSNYAIQFSEKGTSEGMGRDGWRSHTQTLTQSLTGTYSGVKVFRHHAGSPAWHSCEEIFSRIDIRKGLSFEFPKTYGSSHTQKTCLANQKQSRVGLVFASYNNVQLSNKMKVFSHSQMRDVRVRGKIEPIPILKHACAGSALSTFLV